MQLSRRSLVLSPSLISVARAQGKKLSASVIDGINNHDWEAPMDFGSRLGAQRFPTAGSPLMSDIVKA